MVEGKQRMVGAGRVGDGCREAEDGWGGRGWLERGEWLGNGLLTRPQIAESMQLGLPGLSMNNGQS